MTIPSPYLRIATASPKLIVADPSTNTKEILNTLEDAWNRGVQIVCFPELSVPSYTAGDLFYQEQLIAASEAAIKELIRNTAKFPSLVYSIGTVLSNKGQLYNVALLIQGDTLLGIVPKTYIPNTNEFYEGRWFSSGQRLEGEVHLASYAGQMVPFGEQMFELEVDDKEVILGIEICEDLWAPKPPSIDMALNGATVILNLSASNELVGKATYRRQLILQQSASLNCAYIYANASHHESTTDLVYSGHSLICENGQLLAESKPFNEGLTYADIDFERLQAERLKNVGFRQKQDVEPIYSSYVRHKLNPTPWDKLERTIDPHPFIPSDPQHLNERCEEIFNILAHGVKKRLTHTNAKTAVIGISGGLDSTLALLVLVDSFNVMNKPLSDIVAVTMPGFGTTDHTYQNALGLMEELGVSVREISIEKAVMQHFEDIGHDPNLHDITYENSQARERTQILMDIANQVGGLVMGTGDLSELALGWCTYNGDQMSMYGVNASVPKTLVRHLISWRASKAEVKLKQYLESIVNTPISPELLPPDEEGQIAQHTEESTGPYELHDFFMYHVLRHGTRPIKVYQLALHAFKNHEVHTASSILHWLKVFYRRFFSQQFKRSSMPDGPKIGSVSLSPRGDFRMPSDASSQSWLKELESLSSEN